MFTIRRLIWVVVGNFLIVASVPAQEGKPPTGRDVVLGIAASGLDAKLPAFKAPELKPITVKLPTAFSKPNPESVDDLKAIQDHVAKTVEMVSPAVVSVRVGNASGSAVIVTKDGYVLTAGHVSGEPGRHVTVFFHYKKKTVAGITLGANRDIDSGMIKITDPAPEGGWPVAEMGDSAAMKKGEWCMVIAHPGGFKVGRTPPVRLGRLLKADAGTLTTDCILVGGDSGGPLFDMYGRVIGINSRIGNPLTMNMHVPVNPFRETWDKIARSEVWGNKIGVPPPVKTVPWLGVYYDQINNGCVVTSVMRNSPAEKAGLKEKDVILKFDSKDVNSDNLARFVQARKIGDQVTVEIRRGEETLALKIEIAKRPPGI